MSQKMTIAPRHISAYCWQDHLVVLEMTATDGMTATYRGRCHCGEDIKRMEVLRDERQENNR